MQNERRNREWVFLATWSMGLLFVGWSEALEDDAYRLPDGYVGPKGLSWVHRWAVAKGMKLEVEPREPEWLSGLYRDY